MEGISEVELLEKHSFIVVLVDDGAIASTEFLSFRITTDLYSWGTCLIAVSLTWKF